MRRSNRNMRRKGRVLAAIALAGLAASGCRVGGEDSAEKGQSWGVEKVTTTTTAGQLGTGTTLEAADLTCLVIAPDADTQPDGLAQMKEIWGPIDFDGVGNDWVAINSGAVLGYSAHEDSIIWNLPQCISEGPQYMKDAE